MWIVKGVLLGVLIFAVGGISYAGIRLAIVFHRLAQQIKAGTATHGGGIEYDIRLWLHDPVLWTVVFAALFVAIAIGLWIVRVRSHAT